jgi:hypothetical protein
MTSPRPPRDRERGNSLVLALIVMSSLATLGSLTVVSVQSSLKSSTNERAQTIAMYAAESGGAMAMQFLRTAAAFEPNALAWSDFVEPANAPHVLGPPQLPAGGAIPGSADNPFTIDQNASFTVELFNNRGDPGVATGDDTDAQIVIRVTGNGPQGSVAIIEWEIRRVMLPVPAPPDPAPPDPPPWINSLGVLVSPADPLVLVGWHAVL